MLRIGKFHSFECLERHFNYSWFFYSHCSVLFLKIPCPTKGFVNCQTRLKMMKSPEESESKNQISKTKNRSHKRISSIHKLKQFSTYGCRKTRTPSSHIAKTSSVALCCMFLFFTTEFYFYLYFFYFFCNNFCNLLLVTMISLYSKHFTNL